MLGIHEVTGLHVLDGHGDGKGLVSGDVLEVLGVGELGGGHSGSSRNAAHRRWVARPCCNLLTIRKGLVCRKTEVNEVVCRSQGCDLTSRRRRLAIVCKTFGNDCGVEC